MGPGNALLPARVLPGGAAGHHPFPAPFQSIFAMFMVDQLDVFLALEMEMAFNHKFGMCRG